MFGAAVVWALLLWNINANSVEEKQLPPHNNDNIELNIAGTKVEGLSERTAIVNEEAGIVYVSSSGHNTTECGYDTTPCLTLLYAIDQVFKISTNNTRRIFFKDQYTVSESVIIGDNKQINFEGNNPNYQLPITIAGNNTIAFKGTNVDSSIENFYIHIDKSGNISYVFYWVGGSLSLRNNRVNFAEGSSNIGLAQIINEGNLTIDSVNITGTPLEPLKFGSKNLIFANYSKYVSLSSIRVEHIDVESDKGLIYISQYINPTPVLDDPEAPQPQDPDPIHPQVKFLFVTLYNVTSHNASVVHLATELLGNVDIQRSTFELCEGIFQADQRTEGQPVVVQEIEGGALSIAYNGGDVQIGGSLGFQSYFIGCSSVNLNGSYTKGAAIFISLNYDLEELPGLINIRNIIFSDNKALMGSNIFIDVAAGVIPSTSLTPDRFQVEYVGSTSIWTQYMGIVNNKDYFLLQEHILGLRAERRIRYVEAVTQPGMPLCGDWVQPCHNLDDIEPEAQPDRDEYNSNSSQAVSPVIAFYVKGDVKLTRDILARGNIIIEGRPGLKSPIVPGSGAWEWNSYSDNAKISVERGEPGGFADSSVIFGQNSSITLRTLSFTITDDIRSILGLNPLVQVEGPELVLDRVQILNIWQRAVVIRVSNQTGAATESKGLIYNSEIISPEDKYLEDGSVLDEPQEGSGLCNFNGSGVVISNARVQIIGSTISGFEGGGVQVTNQSYVEIDIGSKFERNNQKRVKYPVMRQNVECTQGSTVIFEEGVMERETIVGTW
ncbi:MAG: hypothetical protein EZS28_035566, partial [Streblomastix strix]